MIAITPDRPSFKRDIVRNDIFATRASLSDLGALECPFGLLNFPFGRNGSNKGRVWIQERALPPKVATRTPPWARRTRWCSFK